MWGNKMICTGYEDRNCASYFQLNNVTISLLLLLLSLLSHLLTFNLFFQFVYTFVLRNENARLWFL